MGDCMTFNDNPMDFIRDYSFKDTEELYTNGSELIAVFRVKQMMDHYMPKWIPVTDRLPDVPEGTKDEDCPEFIVTIAGAEKPTSLKCDPEGTWFDDFGNVYSVYAWMPMPEAYRIEY